MKTKNITYIALLLALAVVFSYVEILIPIPVPIPGIKLGLANGVILYCLYKFSPGVGFLVGLSKVIIIFALFGNVYSFLFSLFGFILSYLVMLICIRSGLFSVYGVSICGAVFHNIGQILVAIYVANVKGIVIYLPVLTIVAIFTGSLNAFLVNTIIKRISKDDCLY